jgi:hypothetical protein
VELLPFHAKKRKMKKEERELIITFLICRREKALKEK